MWRNLSVQGRKYVSQSEFTHFGRVIEYVNHITSSLNTDVYERGDGKNKIAEIFELSRI